MIEILYYPAQKEKLVRFYNILKNKILNIDHQIHKYFCFK